ncbi:hypothetical protein VU04_11325 [Desulfobulbus sp. TB]|nr:hypothetical protein [Desulfobulbus sp. TB]
MKFLQRVLLATALLPVLLCGCTYSPLEFIRGHLNESGRDALHKNRLLWKKAHLSNYTYTYKRRCFCPPEEDIAVEVQYGNVIRASYFPSSDPVMPERLDSLMTVTELFQVIEKALIDEVAQLDVTYNAKLGYPERIYIDIDRRMADEEMEHLVSKLH